jgi:kumamolisin
VAHSHSVVVGSERFLRPGAVATGPADGKEQIEVTLKLRRKTALPALSKRPASVMTRQQLAAKYGASSADMTKVAKAFAKYGLKQVAANSATRTIRLRGPIAKMEEAFDVKLFKYTQESESFRGRVGPVHVPSELKSIVQGVFGLDNRRMVQHRRQPVRPTNQSQAATGAANWYIPSELAEHYNFPPGDGSGQAVGLLEFGGGYFQNDLQKFCTMANVPSLPNVVAVSTDGTPTNSNDPAAGEVMLDVEVVAGACPKAKVVVYFAQFTEQGWITILDAAIHDTKNDPGVLSVSWGFAEDKLIWTQQAMTQINESLKEAALVGVTVCVAAGDDGSSDAIPDGHAHVNFPASSPYVLSVGGTTIPVRGSKQPDVVWKEGSGVRATGGGSTGGGTSAQFARPGWQKKIKIKSVNPGGLVGRCLPDIAANADWTASPYLLVVNGTAQGNGGTSAATPLLASLLTRINEEHASSGKHRVGYVTPVLYQTKGRGSIGSAGCVDVIKGDNDTASVGGYDAGVGYDAVSGWGTPDGMQLAHLL